MPSSTLHFLFPILFFSFTVFLSNCPIVLGNQNYRDALAKSILFFQGQRSGRLPPPTSQSQHITWRGNSGLQDGQLAGVDLSGGYYDAGDNVKFNFPMAFTTTMLSWGYIEYGKKMGPQLASNREAIRWATDYLLKCARATPAALAAASIVFRKLDPTYSKLLLSTAKSVMQFAIQHRGSYSDSLASAVCPFYCSYSGYTDELLWGAAWLFRATNEVYYLNLIRSLGANDATDIFSWDNKYAGARVLLARRILVDKDQTFDSFRQQAEDFMCRILPNSPSSTTQYTPGGLMFKLSASNLEYVTSITFLLTTYSKYMATSKHSFNCGNVLVTSKTLRSLAKRQVDYILGDNPMKMSYMVGYGTNYPRRIHHRGSSLPSLQDHPQSFGCEAGFQPFYYTPNPNQNVLTGAIVEVPTRMISSPTNALITVTLSPLHTLMPPLLDHWPTLLGSTN
ncbi:UNVERIFIED_CONTAM: Endoglucanase 3 [Sesamum latifolium]|uniref:Endoglucanase n=1 Tax=Sesamum latifolium TaxID=2727402 RepID=A0AAW2XQS1_9LAMI